MDLVFNLKLDNENLLIYLSDDKIDMTLFTVLSTLFPFEPTIKAKAKNFRIKTHLFR